jgi:hypothetical protein
MKLFPNKNFDRWHIFPNNPNFSGKYLIDYIENTPREEFEKSHVFLPGNINMTYELFEKCGLLSDGSKIYDNYMSLISMHPNITYEMMKNNPQYDWDYRYAFMFNPNITMDIIRDDLDKFSDGVLEYLCYNENFTYEMIKNEPRIKIKYKYLINNPNITFDIIKNDKNLLNAIQNLCKNPNINTEIVKNNPQMRWNYDLIASHPNIDPHFAMTITKNMRVLSRNPNITFEFVEKYKNVIAFDYWELSAHMKLTYEDVINNPDFPWVLQGLSDNKFNKKRSMINNILFG